MDYQIGSTRRPGAFPIMSAKIRFLIKSITTNTIFLNTSGEALFCKQFIVVKNITKKRDGKESFKEGAKGSPKFRKLNV